MVLSIGRPADVGAPFVWRPLVNKKGGARRHTKEDVANELTALSDSTDPVVRCRSMCFHVEMYEHATKLVMFLKIGS